MSLMDYKMFCMSYFTIKDSSLAAYLPINCIIWFYIQNVEGGWVKREAVSENEHQGAPAGLKMKNITLAGLQHREMKHVFFYGCYVRTSVFSQESHRVPCNAIFSGL